MAPSPSVETGPPQRIQELLSKTGEELPILKQSCRGIIDRTDDDSSNANDVSEVIMHDQALLAKVLKLANSAIYHSSTPISSSLQAVKVMGFDVIRAVAIGAEFVERADERGGDTAGLKKLLARALVSATAAQELEDVCEFPKNPNLFTSTMLYTLGDLVLAHYLPDIYRILESAQRHEPERLPALETELLGQTLRGLAARMAREWGLPGPITTIIESNPNLEEQRWNTPQDRLAGLVCTSNMLGNCLLSPPTPSVQATLQELLERVPQALNLSPKTLRTIMINAFKKASHLSSTMNIENKYCVPNSEWETLEPSNSLKNFVDEIWKATNTHQESKLQPKVSKEKASTQHTTNLGSPSQDEFTWLQDFTLKALGTSDPNQILQWGTEGLYSTGNFDRVVLTLLSPEKGVLEPRTGYGEGVKEKLSHFRCSTKGQHLFAIAFRGCQPKRVENLEDEVKAGRLPKEFIQEWGNSPFLLGSVFAKSKPIGLVIADKGISQQPITPAEYATFAMVLSQINVNLARLVH